jgi:hypothetical protein
MKIGEASVPKPRTDQLGMGIVAYWPSITEDDLG